jgi:hypothetical protein
MPEASGRKMFAPGQNIKRGKMRPKAKNSEKTTREVTHRILLQLACDLRFVLTPATSSEITKMAVNRKL